MPGSIVLIDRTHFFKTSSGNKGEKTVKHEEVQNYISEDESVHTELLKQAVNLYGERSMFTKVLSKMKELT